MHKIDSLAVRGGEFSGGIFRPRAISAICPCCNSLAVFTLTGFSSPGPQNSVSADGSCPSCKKKVGFWTLNPGSNSSVDTVLLYMHPAPQGFYPDIAENDPVPPLVMQALRATINAYNARVYAAAAVSGRRTLEGIFKFLVPEEQRELTLVKLIEVVKRDNDLVAPLTALSHAIRNGGNLGAHFDMEKEPTEAVARQIVELLTYLVSYLYVLPAKIEKLESDINS